MPQVLGKRLLTLQSRAERHRRICQCGPPKPSQPQPLILANTPNSCLHWRVFNASHAARCVACHGERSHAVPVALVGDSSMPVV